MPTVGYALFEEAMIGAWRVAREKGYNLLIQEAQPGAVSPEHFSKMIFSKEADGVLSFTGSLPAQDEIPKFRHLKQPPVVVGFEFIEPEMQTFPSVHIDNMDAARQATDYLISMRHRRIGFIGSTSEHYYANEREQAYRAAIQAAGLPLMEDLIAHCDVSIEESRKCTRRLLHLPERPTAIFCGGGDDMAIGAIHALAERTSDHLVAHWGDIVG